MGVEIRRGEKVDYKVVSGADAAALQALIQAEADKGYYVESFAISGNGAAYAAVMVAVNRD